MSRASVRLSCRLRTDSHLGLRGTHSASHWPIERQWYYGLADWFWPCVVRTRRFPVDASIHRPRSVSTGIYIVRQRTEEFDPGPYTLNVAAKCAGVSWQRASVTMACTMFSTCAMRNR